MARCQKAIKVHGIISLHKQSIERILSGMAENKALHKAAKAKKDEFYTQLTDIEKELRH